MKVQGLFVAGCLATLPVLADENVGSGFEPSIITNRRTGNDRRLMHFWMDGAQATLKYRRSINQGQAWAAAQTIGPSGSGILNDPTLGTHFTNGHVYFEWAQKLETTDVGLQFRRSPSGDNLDSAFEIADGVGADRPWLAANSKSVYSTFFLQGQTDKANIRRVDVNSDGTMGSWGSGQAFSTATSGTRYSAHLAVAGGQSDDSTDRVHTLLVQFHPTAPLSAAQALRYVASSDGGSTWSSMDLVNLAGVDGMYESRDIAMAFHHISTDRSSSRPHVYAFYVRVEHVYDGPSVRKAAILYSKASYNHGANWGGERKIYSLPYGSLPSGGFADVPENSSQSTAGFYRIVRVWSCVDQAGGVHVVWFDNRAGKSTRTGLTDRDEWRVYRSSSSDSGDTLSTPSAVASATSIGGYGFPTSNGTADKHLPPGDFIACDADDEFLYVTWPDTRDFTQSSSNADTRIYFEKVAL